MLVKKFEDLMDELILEKGKRRLSCEEIGNGSGLTRQSVSKLLSTNLRDRANIDSMLRVARYFDELNKEGN